MRQRMTRREKLIVGGLLAVLLGMAATWAWPHLRRPPVDPDIDAYTRGDFPNGMTATADRMLHRAEREAMPADQRAVLLQLAAELYRRAGRTDDIRRAVRAEIELVRRQPVLDRSPCGLMWQLYELAPSAATRAGLAERRRVYAEIVRLEASAGGQPVDSTPPTQLMRDISEFLKANAETLVDDERAALVREVRLLWEQRIGDWRTYPIDYELIDLAQALAADGEPEKAAPVMARAIGLTPDAGIGTNGLRHVRMKEEIEYRYPHPCDIRRLDAYAALIDWDRVRDWTLAFGVIHGYATADRLTDAIRHAERLVENEEPTAESNCRWAEWSRLRWLAEFHRSAGNEEAAREIELGAYIQYPDIVCAIGS